MWFPLKRQLGVIGVLLLFIPLFGVLSLRFVEYRLNNYQAELLAQRTETLANILSADITGVSVKDRYTINPFFVNSLMTNDGFDDDWELLPNRPTIIVDQNAELRIRSAQTDHYLWLLIQTDNHTPFQMMSNGKFIDGDTLRLKTSNEEYLVTRTERSLTRVVNSTGQNAPLISAFWKRLEEGNRIEIKIPRELVGQNFGIEFRGRSHRGVDFRIATFNASESAPSISWTLLPAQRTLERYQSLVSQADVRLIDQYGNLLAWAGDSNLGNQTKTLNWLQRISLMLSTDSSDSVLTISSSWDLMTLLRLSDENQITDHNRAVAILGDPWPTGALLSTQLLPCGATQCPLLVVIEPKTMGYVLWQGGQVELLSLLLGGSFVVILLISLWVRWQARRLGLLKSRMMDYTAAASNSRVVDEISALGSEFNRLQQQVDANTDYLENLAVRLSHELKTPLSVIRSSLESLKSGNADLQGIYTERAIRGSEQLQSIFQQLTEARNLEQLLANRSPEKFHLDTLLEALVGGYQQIHDDVVFELHLPDRDIEVSSDEDFLAQALMKLIDNAISFHTIGTPIGVHMTRVNRQVSIKVINQGPPLPEPSNGIFDAFVSLRATAQSDHLGFGLHIAKLICAHFGHRLRAQNVGNRRVCFEILIDP